MVKNSMRRIKPQLTGTLKAHVRSRGPGKTGALAVRNYRELMRHVAQLAHANKDYLLFFRGQGRDHLNKAGASTVYPSIYRGERLSTAQRELRFDVLASAGRRLCDSLASAKIVGHREVRRRRFIQWSILQHYQVCPTPLLDLTHSLRVACSFALQSSSCDDPLLFVFALPYVTNRVSVNSEYDLVTVRLLGICPPEALRPYFQDGYMAGTDPEASDHISKSELDFNRVLLAKFRLPRGKSFWSAGFGALPETALYPPNDRVDKICKALQSELGTEVEPGRLGQFLQAWTDLESRLMSAARRREERVFSLREALGVLRREERVPQELLSAVDRLRKTRNLMVHHPSELGAKEVSLARAQAESLLESLGERGVQ